MKDKSVQVARGVSMVSRWCVTLLAGRGWQLQTPMSHKPGGDDRDGAVDGSRDVRMGFYETAERFV